MVAALRDTAAFLATVNLPWGWRYALIVVLIVLHIVTAISIVGLPTVHNLARMIMNHGASND
jgi:hypothetical protein